MDKIIYSDSQDELLRACGGQMVTLVDDNKSIKQAASSAFSKKMIQDNHPDKDHVALHMVAMGDGEHYSWNRNGDYWPSEWNEKKAHTFKDFGHYFLEHNNRDPKHKIGDIKAAAYNKDMRRIELLIWADKKKASTQIEKAREGKTLTGSMSAKIHHDTCSCCGHKAARSKLYCDHLKHHMGQWLPEFNKFAYAINYDPTFFDYSDVANPADRVAYALQYVFGDEGEQQKAASAGSKFMFSDELAERLGVTLPQSVIFNSYDIRRMAEKLASAEKIINNAQVNLTANNSSLNNMERFALQAIKLARSESVSDFDLKLIRQLRPESFFYQLVKRAAILPFDIFTAYIKNIPLSEARQFKLANNCQAELINKGPIGEELFRAPSIMIGEIDPAYTPEIKSAMDNLAANYSAKPELIKTALITCELSGNKIKFASVDNSKEDTDLSRVYATYRATAAADIENIHGEDYVDDKQMIWFSSSNNR